jgi:hypothetical protein
MSRSLDTIAVVALFLVAMPAFAQNAPPPPPDGPPPALFPSAPPPSPFQATLPPPPPPHAPTFFSGETTPGIVIPPCDTFALWNNPGLFVGFEADLVFPEFTRFSNRDIKFPTAGLGATVMPVAELGYRFESGSSVLFRYRYLDSSGNGSFSDTAAGLLNKHSRLVNNTWDIDYQSRIYGGAGGWGLQWAIGGRIADFEEKTQIGSDLIGDILARNDFTGAGPHASLSAWRAFGDSGWAAFATVDGSVLFGYGRQSLTFNLPAEFGDPAFSFGVDAHGLEIAPGLNARIGLSWTRLIGPALVRVDGGYVYEEWWLSADGKNSDKGALYRQIGWRDQGLFMRMELGF